MEEKEVWQNTSGSQVYIKVLDPMGREVAKHIRPRQRVTISSLERRINQDVVRNDKFDVFKNGMLSAVKLIETEQDVAELQNNPNVIAESELADIFKLRGAKFKNRIAEIDSFAVIRRLLEYAEGEDTPASMAHVRALEARRDELDEAPKVVYSDPNDPVPAVRYD